MTSTLGLPPTLSPRAWFGRRLVGLGAIALLSTLSRLVVPLTVAYAVDNLMTPDGPLGLRATGDILAAAGLTLLVATVCSVVLSLRMATRTEAVLDAVRVNAFRRLAAPGVGRERAAAREFHDIDQASQFVRWTGPGVLIQATSAVVGVVVMLWYSWVMALGVLPLVLGVLVAARRRSTSHHRDDRRFARRLQRALRDTVVQSGEARSHAAQRSVASRTEALATDYDRHRLRMVAAESRVRFGSEVAIGLAVAISVLVGLPLVATGRVSLGAFVGSLLTLWLVVAPSLPVLGESIPAYRLANAQWRRSARATPR